MNNIFTSYRDNPSPVLSGSVNANVFCFDVVFNIYVYIYKIINQQRLPKPKNILES